MPAGLMSFECCDQTDVYLNCETISQMQGVAVLHLPWRR
jgi:hypothetical protein